MIEYSTIASNLQLSPIGGANRKRLSEMIAFFVFIVSTYRLGHLS
jgi:hypothetical protein